MIFFLGGGEGCESRALLRLSHFTLHLGDALGSNFKLFVKLSGDASPLDVSPVLPLRELSQLNWRARLESPG